MRSDSLVAIARLGRVFGLKGELFANGLDRGIPKGSVWLYRADQPEESRFVEYRIATARRHQNRWLLRFEGVDTVTAAEALCGAEVRVAADSRAALPDGEYYYSDLVGCAAVEHGSGRPLGRIVDWADYGGPPVFVIETEGRRFEAPFAESIFVRIDLAAGRVELDLPEGLAEI